MEDNRIVLNEVKNNESNTDMPSASDIWVARKRVSQIAARTPLVYSEAISKQTESNIYLKLETLQPIGAFKLRGATNKILSLSPEKQKLGVATYSTGNHGIAVAYVAKQLGIPAYVFISNRVPQAKIDVLENLGAIVKIHGEKQDDAGEYCYQLAKEKGMTVVEPFDDPYVLTGQGTIGLEVLEDLPEVDTVIIPLSGGGLCSGIAMALKANNPNIRVIGLSMEGGAVMYHSIKAGKPIIMDEVDTLADSLLGGIGEDNKYTFELVKKYVDEVMLVSEEDIAKGMAYILKNHRIVAEGASSIGAGAILGGKIENLGKNVALIVTGNNMNLDSFMEATKQYL